MVASSVSVIDGLYPNLEEVQGLRSEHEAVLDAMARRLPAMPDAMAVRRCTVEHVFGTIKGWMGATHFRTRGLKNVATEASLAILAYNIKRAIAVAGVASTLKAITG